MARTISFQEAKAKYPYRYTAEHVPAWALKPEFHENSKTFSYYAPQFKTDREWYENTIFPGEQGHDGVGDACITRNQKWPFGIWLDKPFKS